MFSESNPSKAEGLKLLKEYQQWFDDKGFIVHSDKMEFIKFKDKEKIQRAHWKVDATIVTENEGKKTHTFFMTPSTLSMWIGFGKKHVVVMRIVSGHEESRFEEMRDKVNGYTRNG